MEFFENKGNSTERNLFTRQCIGDALIKLMKKKTIDEITVKDIVNCAGVSRMTYYKYYSSKSEILTDYLYEVVKEYIHQTKTYTNIGTFNDYTHICHCFNFFKNYSDFALTLIRANQYSIIINTVNEYMDLFVLPVAHHTKYEIYYYAGALCNIYAKWIEGGMQEPPEEVAEIVYRFIHGEK